MFSQAEPLFRNDDPAFEPRESRGAKWFRYFALGFTALCGMTVLVWALSGKPAPEVKHFGKPAGLDRVTATDDPNRVPNQDQPIYDRIGAGTSGERGRELLPGAEPALNRNELAARLNPSTSDSGDSPATGTPHTDNNSADGAAASSAPPAAAKNDPPAQPSAADANATGDATTVAALATDFRIQIASVRTEQQAEAEWRRIKNRHADLLGKLSSFYPKHESGSRGTYYRVQAGPLVDKALADLLCSQLKARKVDCFVLSP